jgi:hypothetical protein
LSLLWWFCYYFYFICFGITGLYQFLFHLI